MNFSTFVKTPMLKTASKFKTDHLIYISLAVNVCCLMDSFRNLWFNISLCGKQILYQLSNYKHIWNKL